MGVSRLGLICREAMKLKLIAVIATVALLVTTGAALAAPGNAPDDAGAATVDDGTSADEAAENGSAAAENRDENGSAAADEHAQGPPDNLPEPVPDHVGQIHDLVRQFLNGSLEGSLGEAISDGSVSDTPGSANESHANG